MKTKNPEIKRIAKLALSGVRGPGWLVMGDAELYDYAEIGKLTKCARRAVRQNSLAPLEYMRRTFAGLKLQRGGSGHNRGMIRHHHSCQCKMCGGQNLQPGWIAGPVKGVSQS